MAREQAVRLLVLPEAWADLEAGVDFYDRQVAGLGGAFLDHLLAQIRSLQTKHGIHPTVAGRFHRFVTDQRFPYAIYYRFDDAAIFVYAVLDCRRSPAWIRLRLAGE